MLCSNAGATAVATQAVKIVTFFLNCKGKGEVNIDDTLMYPTGARLHTLRVWNRQNSFAAWIAKAYVSHAVPRYVPERADCRSGLVAGQPQGGPVFGCQGFQETSDTPGGKVGAGES